MESKHTRALEPKERDLIIQLLSEANVISDLNNQLVFELDDGGMGSIQFVRDSNAESRRMKEIIIEKEFYDSDGVPILVSLTTDEDDQLFELDIWKVDFSPVIRYPYINVIVPGV